MKNKLESMVVRLREAASQERRWSEDNGKKGLFYSQGVCLGRAEVSQEVADQIEKLLMHQSDKR